jgi:hypothetical protein
MDQFSAQITRRVEESPLSDDLIFGMAAISAWYGLTQRQAYHKAAQGTLPGIFQMGGLWVCSKTVAREAVRTAAKEKPKLR